MIYLMNQWQKLLTDRLSLRSAVDHPAAEAPVKTGLESLLELVIQQQKLPPRQAFRQYCS